ncbi:GntR family transcriptional regulator [Shewanella sp. UCD-FRSSP16_17]|uniref:GntR family transcriptional regulator n=2 Tax=unclassified Shewanella TaxID=196818 RepID=UPI0009ED8E84|nr:GntR family transcriptional regulator [Shewanella sp. UCD-FRSSP16_17]
MLLLTQDYVQSSCGTKQYLSAKWDVMQLETDIYSRILADIAQGELVSGDRLITTLLAKRYDSSVNPVREALKLLEGEGFVTFKKNSGARVANFAYSSMRDVFEILQLLEPYFLSWYVSNASQESLDKLARIHQKMTLLPKHEASQLRQLDTEFHWEMYRHHYNQSALVLWKNKKLMLQALLGNLAVKPSRYEAILREHSHLLYLINAKDEESAVRTLTKHVKSGGDYWQSNVALES